MSTAGSVLRSRAFSLTVIAALGVLLAIQSFRAQHFTSAIDRDQKEKLRFCSHANTTVRGTLREYENDQFSPTPPLGPTGALLIGELVGFCLGRDDGRIIGDELLSQLWPDTPEKRARVTSILREVHQDIERLDQ
jgi:hypothetical protein